MNNSTAYPFLVSLEAAVASANADSGALGYLIRSGHRAALKTQTRFANTDTPVFETTTNGEGRINGYKAAVSNQILTNLTTGTASTLCSAIVFGNWNDLFVANFHNGATDLICDPFTLATSGVIRIVARRWVAIAPRHSASFCVGGGVLTN